jgi:hypothetical protein
MKMNHASSFPNYVIICFVELRDEDFRMYVQLWEFSTPPIAEAGLGPCHREKTSRAFNFAKHFISS